MTLLNYNPGVARSAAQLLVRLGRWGYGLAVVACLGVMAQPGAYVEQSGAQIRAALSGKYLTDEHHWGQHYRPDGRLFRVERGSTRKGRWLLQQDQLCWNMAETSTQPECFHVFRRADEVQYRDQRGYVVWQGFIRNRAGTHVFDGVTER